MQTPQDDSTGDTVSTTSESTTSEIVKTPVHFWRSRWLAPQREIRVDIASESITLDGASAYSDPSRYDWPFEDLQIEGNSQKYKKINVGRQRHQRSCDL